MKSDAIVMVMGILGAGTLLNIMLLSFFGDDNR
jgi:hypothetical protein